MALTARKNQPMPGVLKIRWSIRKIMGRGLITPRITASTKLTWLHTRMAAPSVGKCSAPEMRQCTPQIHFIPNTAHRPQVLAMRYSHCQPENGADSTSSKASGMMMAAVQMSHSTERIKQKVLNMCRCAGKDPIGKRH